MHTCFEVLCSGRRTTRRRVYPLHNKAIPPLGEDFGSGTPALQQPVNEKPVKTSIYVELVGHLTPVSRNRSSDALTDSTFNRIMTEHLVYPCFFSKNGRKDALHSLSAPPPVRYIDIKVSTISEQPHVTKAHLILNILSSMSASLTIRK